MLSKSLFFVIFLLIANGAMGQTGEPEIKSPWARATPGHAENGAAYLTIVSLTPDRLTAASSPVAKKAELHTMSMEENQTGESGENGGIRKRVAQAMGTKRQIHCSRSRHYSSFAMG
jgi:hypothetical protein